MTQTADLKNTSNTKNFKMATSHAPYLENPTKPRTILESSRSCKHKLAMLKTLIKETVFENMALCDEISEIQELILIRSEERKFFLRKLCQVDPQVEIEVQQVMNHNFPQPPTAATNTSTKKGKKRSNTNERGERKVAKPRKTLSKVRKKVVQLIPLDQSGRPIFPIALGNLTIHSLGEVLSDRTEFHCEDAIYPIGYVSTRIYANVKEPTTKCVYTCKISDVNGLPRFEIASDSDKSSTIVGGSPNICHSLLLQSINDTLSLNVVSTRPRGNDFFGLTHPTILNLIQSSPSSRKCVNYKWSKFEVSKNGDHYIEDPDTCLNFDSLQRSINYCKYKMAATCIPPLPHPPEHILEARDSFSHYLM